jgi:hypothetical protein
MQTLTQPLTHIALKTLTASERHARVLLAAWNSGNLARLREAIADNGTGPRISAAEQEKFELLEEISAAIGRWIDGRNGQDALHASLDILKHLARATEAPQFEIRVSVLN